MKSSSTTPFWKSALRSALLCLILLIAQPISTAFADSLREVAERVARENDAKLVSAREVKDRDGRTIYEIRILTRDGVVRTIRVRARNREQLDYVQSLAVVSQHWHVEIEPAQLASYSLPERPALGIWS